MLSEREIFQSHRLLFIYKKILVSSKWTLFSLKLLSMTLIHIITVCNTCITLPWGLSIVYLFFSWDRISKLTEILLPSFRFFQIAYNLKKKERIKDNAFIIIKLNILHVFFFSRTLSIFHNTCLSSWWRQMVKLRNQKCRLLKKHHTLHININLMQRIFNALLKFLFLGTIYTVFKM